MENRTALADGAATHKRTMSDLRLVGSSTAALIHCCLTIQMSQSSGPLPQFIEFRMSSTDHLPQFFSGHREQVGRSVGVDKSVRKNCFHTR